MRKHAGRPVAMRARLEGRWADLSYPELADRVQDLSLGLFELGVQPGDRIAILSENRPEWAMVDYACLAARCTDVPIYPTLTAKQAEYILRDSGAVVAVASTPGQLEKLVSLRDRLPLLRHIVVVEPPPAGGGGSVVPLAELAARGRAARDRHPDWEAEALRAQPEDLATIIYTSGTTGDPKGVMLTHGNIASNVTTCLALFDWGPGDECLSFLPLSHIFERMFGHYCMFSAGVLINYAESIDTVAANMLELRPTMMAAVPRLYEKIYSRVLDGVRSAPAPKRRLFAWARRVGEEWAVRTIAGQPVPVGLAIQRRIADRLVFAKLRSRTGGRFRFLISGGAPLSPEIAKFFYAAGMPILEGYGLTETSPVMSVNTFARMRLGTVGPPIPGVEIRIAPDGEILTRGPNVMRGYFGKPEATADAINPDGWFHTGDIGMLDAEGYLRITDRKKDLIVTAGGKNIAPQPIENLAKTSKFVSNAVMLGDRRPFPIMLVVPNAEALRGWAAHRGLPANGSVEELIALPDAQNKVEREVRMTLRDLAQFEMPKKLLLLSRDFSVEDGELTPTLKVRRRIVEQRHREAIEGLYGETSVAP
ncbi:MAG: AMP-dependent synthetase/ligase [Gemmatimonadales bacterium]